ncbi:MAG: serine/threonine-protein kinase [Myxococcota bacterium]
MTDDRTAPMTGGELGASDAPAAGTVLGRYVVIDAVGRGGAGTVVAAYDSVLDRKVALKLLHARSDDRDVAVLREARMLAKVTHPAVVTVYDVGEMDGTPFVSMEFVAGGDLTRAGQPARSLDEAVDLWVAAAQGVAAAHAAEIVHGDLKPANVLIDDRGQPKVTDFGIATAIDRSPSLAPEAREADMQAGATDHSVRRAGTPRYMAPEQLDGARASVASDVYALCVTLAELIEGRPPWRTLAERAEGADPVLARLRREHGAPTWLTDALRRGLAEAPQDRWPSVRALLAEVERHRRPRRSRALLTVAALAPLAAIGWVATQQDHEVAPWCETGPNPLDAVYNDGVVEGLAAGWAAIEQPGADRAWSDLHEQLEAYANEWRTSYATTCAAAADDALARATMACLRRRAASLGAALQPLREPTPTVVFDAHGVVASLPRLDACRDPARVASGQHEYPSDVAGLIDRSHGLLAAGSAPEAVRVAKEAVHEARAHPSLPMLMAEAQYALGSALSSDGQPAAARVVLEEAYYTALEHESDLALHAAGSLASVVGDHLKRADEGLVWQTHAEVGRRKRGLDVGQSMSKRASLLASRGDLEEAVVAQREALAKLEEEGAARRFIASSHHRSGIALRDQGKLDEARAEWTQAAALYRETLGEDHPHLWQTLNGIALIDLARGKTEDAERGLQDVITNLGRILGERHADLGPSLQNLAIVHAQTGRADLALEEFRRAAAVVERTAGEGSLRVAIVNLNVAVTLDRLDRTDEAIVVFKDVIATYERELAPDHHDHFFAQYGYGAALMNARRYDEAVAAYERAQAVAAVAVPDHLDLPEVEMILGDVTRDAGRPAAESRAWYELALKHLGDRPDGEEFREHARKGLAELDAEP